MLTLETERLFLRDFSMKDWEALNRRFWGQGFSVYPNGLFCRLRRQKKKEDAGTPRAPAGGLAALLHHPLFRHYG